MNNLWILLLFVVGFAVERVFHFTDSGGSIIIRIGDFCLHLHHWMWLLPIVVILTVLVAILQLRSDRKAQIAASTLILVDAYCLGYLVTGFCYDDFHDFTCN
uniref:Uncharacterized protein n=1 Tax=viral metagenome TaxID=1070528 RepID=A0A6C0BMT9_9ZZZZ